MKVSPGAEFWWLALLVALAGLLGCTSPQERPAALALTEVVDRLVFLVQDETLNPIAGAKVKALTEAGQCLGANPVLTDQAGRAVLAVKAQPKSPLSHGSSPDALLDFRTALSFEASAEGYLPAFGRVELFDSWQTFSSPILAQALNRQPADKTRTITLTLIWAADLFAPGQAEGPLARVVEAGLPQLCRQWHLSGRASQLKPAKASWGVEERPNGPYLIAGASLSGQSGGLSDAEVYRIFSDWYLPLLDDLVYVYHDLFAGWDLSLILNLTEPEDPYALPRPAALRLSFAEAERGRLLNEPGGLNRLLLTAESRSLAGLPWNPVENLATKDQRRGFFLEVVSPLFIPGVKETAKMGDGGLRASG